MLTTENQAAHKRCHKDLSSTCIGSMCMAWRWLGFDSGGASKSGDDAWVSRAVIFNANGPADAPSRTWYGGCGLVNLPLSHE